MLTASSLEIGPETPLAEDMMILALVLRDSVSQVFSGAPEKDL